MQVLCAKCGKYVMFISTLCEVIQEILHCIHPAFSAWPTMLSSASSTWPTMLSFTRLFFVRKLPPVSLYVFSRVLLFKYLLREDGKLTGYNFKSISDEQRKFDWIGVWTRDLWFDVPALLPTELSSPILAVPHTVNYSLLWVGCQSEAINRGPPT